MHYKASLNAQARLRLVGCVQRRQRGTVARMEGVMDRDLTIGSLCTARIEAGPQGRVVISPADPYVRRMDEEEGEDLLILAACALRKDPTCIEAHLLLSKHARDLATRIQHLKVAVKAGDYLWGQAAAGSGPLMCWENPGMRPYMRAIQSLGDALAEAGNSAAAEFCYRRLESMGPGFVSLDSDYPAGSGLAMN